MQFFVISFWNLCCEVMNKRNVYDCDKSNRDRSHFLFLTNCVSFLLYFKALAHLTTLRDDHNNNNNNVNKCHTCVYIQETYKEPFFIYLQDHHTKASALYPLKYMLLM